MILECIHAFHGNIATHCFLSISIGLFLVGAYSLKAIKPIITVCSFFSVDNLTLSGPLFLLCDFSRKFLNFIEGYPLAFFQKFSVCKKNV